MSCNSGFSKSIHSKTFPYHVVVTLECDTANCWERLQILWSWKLRNKIFRLNCQTHFSLSWSEVEIKTSFKPFTNKVSPSRNFSQRGILLWDEWQFSPIPLCSSSFPISLFLVRKQIFRWRIVAFLMT